jgi:hypothetical protein
MSTSENTPVGRWSGKVTYEGKVDEFSVDFADNGTLSLTTHRSTGEGRWTANGEGTFTFAVKEKFQMLPNGERPPGVLPGAAYVQIEITARRTGSTFTGSGTAQIRGADESLIHSTQAEMTAQRVIQ